MSVFDYIRSLDDKHLKQALLNVGVDITCGGCASALFTGYPNTHTCEKDNNHQLVISHVGIKP